MPDTGERLYDYFTGPKKKGPNNLNSELCDACLYDRHWCAKHKRDDHDCPGCEEE